MGVVWLTIEFWRFDHDGTEEPRTIIPQVGKEIDEERALGMEFRLAAAFCMFMGCFGRLCADIVDLVSLSVCVVTP